MFNDVVGEEQEASKLEVPRPNFITLGYFITSGCGLLCVLKIGGIKCCLAANRIAQCER
jgi:hypothetical protein